MSELFSLSSARTNNLDGIVSQTIILQMNNFVPVMLSVTVIGWKYTQLSRCGCTPFYVTLLPPYRDVTGDDDVSAIVSRDYSNEHLSLADRTKKFRGFLLARFLPAILARDAARARTRVRLASGLQRATRSAAEIFYLFRSSGTPLDRETRSRLLEERYLRRDERNVDAPLTDALLVGNEEQTSRS